MIKKRFFIVLIITFQMGIFATTSASQNPRIRIRGQVIDNSNKTPLHFVNVFLANTTIGAATDEQGRFSIVNVPLGNYELIASMVGYELFTRQLELTTPEDQEYLIRLEPKPYEAPGLEVSAPFPHEWRQNLKRFKREFLGKSKNASHCEILNPEVLDFDLQLNTGTLKALASEPIQIENRDLGYLVHCHLMDYLSETDGNVRYVCKSRFEPLTPEDDKALDRWKENRLESYRGSHRHLFRSLFLGEAQKEGFRLSIVDFRGGSEHLYSPTVSDDDLLSPIDTTNARELSFSKYLKIIYIREEEPREFNPSPTRAPRQTSWLRMDPSFNVMIDEQGYVSPSFAINTYGYLAWERFAETLPMDYTPEDN
jgi:hypothetical protein